MTSKEALEKKIQECQEKLGTFARSEYINGHKFYVCPYVKSAVSDEVYCLFAFPIRLGNEKYACRLQERLRPYGKTHP